MGKDCNKEFYVYSVTLRDKIIYIGKGTGSRYTHPTSGRSHNSSLNEVWFRYLLLGESEPIVTILEYFDSSESALEAESVLIGKYTPVYNIRGNPNNEGALSSYTRVSTTLRVNIQEFIEWALQQDDCRRLIYTKKYYSDCPEDITILTEVFNSLSDKRENNGGHNKGFAGEHLVGDSAGKKAYGRFKKKYIKDNGVPPSEEDSLVWLNKRKLKQEGV